MNHKIYTDGSEHRQFSIGFYHSKDGGPAFIDSDGTEEWYKNGCRYRDNNPATIEVNGKEYWYKNEKWIE